MKKFIVASSAAIMLFGFGGTSFVQAKEVKNTNVISSLQNQKTDTYIDLDNPEQQAELEQVLTVLETMPDGVIKKGQPAIKEYFNNHGVTVNGDRGAIGCASAIGYAVASGLVAPAKLLKIKKGLKALGGAKTFAKTLTKTYKAEKKKHKKSTAVKNAVKKAGSAARPEFGEAFLALTGVGAIYGECFE